MDRALLRVAGDHLRGMLKDEESLRMAHKDAVLCRWLGLLVLLFGLGAKHVTPNFEVSADRRDCGKGRADRRTLP